MWVISQNRDVNCCYYVARDALLSIKPPRMFKCLTRTENLGEIIRNGKSNNDEGNEVIREEEEADEHEPEWSSRHVGSTMAAV